jgi:type I restriction enzyme S subunit
MTQGALTGIHTPDKWGWERLWSAAPRVQLVGQPDAQPLSVFLQAGVVPRSSREDNHNQLGEDLSKYQVVRPGDLVFNKLRTWQGGLGISNHYGIVSPAYFVCHPRSNWHPRYLHYLLLSMPYLAELSRLSKFMPPSQFDIPWDTLRTLPLLRPPLDEQRRIAGFLDAETARIDALRASRRSQISVLDELELARIGKQLSGVKKTGPVYAYFDVQLGKMLNVERAAGDSQQPYLRNANIHWYEINTEDMATMTFEPDERHRYSVQTGDLMVCEGGAGVAEAAVWDGRMSTCFYQKSLHRVRTRSHVPVEWMMYWLRYAKAIGTFNADGNLATIPHLTGEQLAEYRIQIPEDGHRRVAQLSSEIAAIRKAQREIVSADTLLAERRQALITAAVTGKIDVSTARGAAV